MTYSAWISIQSGEGRIALLVVLCVLSAVAGWVRVVRHSAGDNVVKKVATTIAIGVAGGVVGYLAWAFVAQFFNPAS